MPFFSFLIDF